MDETAPTPPPRSRLFCSYRLIVVFIGFLGYCILYMQRVNLGIAILCMVNNTAVNIIYEQEQSIKANNISVEIVKEDSVTGPADVCASKIESDGGTPDGEFIWPKQLQGLILASFFYGYLPAMIFGGYLSSKFGGHMVSAISIGFSSIGTILLPFAARWNLPALFVCRILIGVAQGFYLPAIGTIWVSWIPKGERARLIGSAMSGIFLGTAIALPMGGYFCSTIGWPSIFYVKGVIGVAWVIIFLIFVKNNPKHSRFVGKNEKLYLAIELPEETNKKGGSKLKTPWLSIITSKVVLALSFCMVAFNWTNYLYLTQIPTYVREVLKLDIRKNGLFTALPYITITVINLVCGTLADALINRNKITTQNVRRIYTCLGFIGAAIFLVLLSFVNCSNPYLGVAFLTIGFTFEGLIFCGGFSLDLYVVGGQFTSIVLGLATAIGNISGIVAPYAISAITSNKKQSEWRWVFWLGAGLSTLGALVYMIFGDLEVQKWAKPKQEKSPEEIELNHTENK